MEKYGGEEHLHVPPKSLLLAQTEEYVEYSRSGKVIKGIEKPKARSIYEEDVYINNHTTIWGSYWNAGRWGYKCCKSFIKNSYCVGMQEPEGYSDQPSSTIFAVPAVPAVAAPDALPRIQGDDEKPEKQTVEFEVDSAPSSEESSEEEDVVEESKKSKKKSKKREKKKKAKEQRKNKKKHKEAKDKERITKDKSTKEKDFRSKQSMEENDDRKRPYNSMYDVKAPTEEEIEEWKKKRPRSDDPMLQFL